MVLVHKIQQEIHEYREVLINDAAPVFYAIKNFLSNYTPKMLLGVLSCGIASFSIYIMLILSQ